MARGKRKTIDAVAIIDMASDGRAVARIDNVVVFVAGAVPGDVANIEVYSTKKNMWEANATHIVSPSPHRIAAPCQHFGLCGGCKWQHFSYETQIRFKEKQVHEAMARIGKIDVAQWRPILGSNPVFNYRNRLDFTFTDQRWITSTEMADGQPIPDRRALGFHIPERWDKIFDVERCLLQPDLSNTIRNFIRDEAKKRSFTFYNLRDHTGFLRLLTVRNTVANAWMLTLQVAEDRPDDVRWLLDTVAARFPEITSIHWVLNTKRNSTIHDLEVIHHAGQPHLVEEMDGLKFRIGPKSFFQTNSRQSLQLYRVVREMAGLTGTENLYDLYTGTGTIGLFVAAKAQKVTGIDYVEEAIADARINAIDNHIDHASFFAGDMKDVLTPNFIALHGRPDVLITDPPRAGMHDAVTHRILEAAPKRVVYVSCNPATQARDLGIMSERYAMLAMQPVDMFPHTHHVENVALLELRP